MKKIMQIKLKVENDTDADLSYLGEIAEKPRYRTYKESWIPTNPDDINNTEWFSPCNHLPHKEENWNHVSQEDKDRMITKYGSLRKADIAYAYEDLKRLQDYFNNRWWMEYFVLIATIGISDDGTNWGTFKIYDSIGGIESDSEKDHKQEIIDDLKHELSYQLKEIGFADNDISTAMSSIQE